MDKTFFIVTPYGDASSKDPADVAMHELITGLRANIIDVAVSRCRDQGYDVKTIVGSDRAGGDNIWEKIGNDLSGAHGVIGVIASSKPNSYIEIGLAYGLWYTPILLHFSECPMPSDLDGTEVGKFSRAQALGEEDAGGLVKWLTERLLNAPPRYNRTIPGYLPATTSSTGRVMTYDRFSKAIDAAEWSDMLWDAEREIILAGPKLFKLHEQAWAGRKTGQGGRLEVEVPFKRILIEKAVNDGVDIIVVMPHPDSVLERDLKRPIVKGGLDRYRQDLGTARAYWEEIEEDLTEARSNAEAEGHEGRIGTIRIVETRRLHFPHRLTMTDKRMLLTLRFYRESVNSRFCIDAGPQVVDDVYNAPIFDLIRSDIDLILGEADADNASRRAPQ